MLDVDVRRLAAVDMYGTAGARWRRWVILAEFLVGVAGIGALGVVLLRAGGAGYVVAGVWALGVAANYAPLAWYALRLIRPGALEAEIAGVDVLGELRRYTTRQFWVLIPFLFVVLALRQATRRP